jgi:3-phenylpropionate/trans-cinnamate dioxygenase ferredoxin reductase subunit
MSQQTFVIVGAGHAGASAAAATRGAGFDGKIILIGSEKHVPYERPPLSKDVLIDPSQARLPIFPPEFYVDKDIDLRLGAKAVAIDRDMKAVVLETGERISYDKLLLACGARARAYPLLDALGEGVFTLRTLEDAQRLHAQLAPGKKLLIVGGGVIGLEVAASAATLGLDVTVLERAPRILARGAPAPLAEFLKKKHTSEGVRLETSVELTQALRSEDGAFQLTAADGRIFVGELVVYGVGVDLNDDLARKAGLELDNGVLIDDQGRTSDPNIYAAGDIARQRHPFFKAAVRQETWANAIGQGSGVGRAMVSGQPCEFEPPWYWTDQFGSNFQVAGQTEAEEWIPRGDVEAEKLILFGLTDGIVTGAVSFDLGREMRAARTMIAAAVRPDRAALSDQKTDLRKLTRKAPERCA